MTSTHHHVHVSHRDSSEDVAVLELAARSTEVQLRNALFSFFHNVACRQPVAIICIHKSNSKLVSPLSTTMIFNEVQVEETEEKVEISDFPAFPDDNLENTKACDVDVDEMLASVLNNLSMEDRERIMFDQHGVANEIDETPDFLDSSIEKFQIQLGKTRRGKRAAIDMAILDEANSLVHDTNEFSVLHDRDMILKFLRVEKFDIKAAVTRYIGFFELKLYCFGRSKLRKRLMSHDDFDEEDHKVIESGVLQVLPTPDRSGRVVVVYFFDQVAPGVSVASLVSRVCYPVSRFQELYSLTQLISVPLLLLLVQHPGRNL